MPASDSTPDLRLQQYVDILLGRGVTWGVLGPREGDRIWDRHIANSLAIVDLVPQASSVIDVGSGAGLPGIPLAIARPDVTVTLLEPMLRRTNFLDGVVDELRLRSRVTVVRGRAEDQSRTYDVVTARAVAPLDRLLGWCLPLVKPGGMLLALKGRSAAEEIAAATETLVRAHRRAEVLEVSTSSDAEPTRVVRVR